MDHIIHRDYIANRRSFIYCSLDCLPVPLCVMSPCYDTANREHMHSDVLHKITVDLFNIFFLH